MTKEEEELFISNMNKSIEEFKEVKSKLPNYFKIRTSNRRTPNEKNVAVFRKQPRKFSLNNNSGNG